MALTIWVNHGYREWVNYGYISGLTKGISREVAEWALGEGTTALGHWGMGHWGNMH